MLDLARESTPSDAQLLVVVERMKPGQENKATVISRVLGQMNDWHTDVAQEFSIELTNVINKYQRKNFQMEQRQQRAEEQQMNVPAPQPQPYQQGQQPSQ